MVGGRWIRRPFLAAVLIGAFVGGSSEPVHAQADPYQARSVFLYRLGGFVQWPEVAARQESPFVIAILGEDPIEEPLLRLVGRNIGGRAVEVRRNVDGSDLDGVDILFVAEPDSERARRVLAGLRGSPILTVGDGEDFVGIGIIGFVVRDRRLAFQINRCVAEQAGLRVNARVLQLADRVVTECSEARR